MRYQLHFGSSRRWPAILVGSFALFVTNWAVLALKAAMKRQWDLLPIGRHLKELEAAGQQGFASILAGVFAGFLITITLRIYLRLLIIDQDEETTRRLFETAGKARLLAEFVVRCATVASLNLVYVSLTGRVASFSWWLLATAGCFVVWDVVMLTRLRRSPFVQNDVFFLLASVAYHIAEGYQGPAVGTVLPFALVATMGATFFVAEWPNVYSEPLRRIRKARRIVQY